MQVFSLGVQLKVTIGAHLRLEQTFWKMLSLREVVTVVKRTRFQFKGVKGRRVWDEIDVTKRRNNIGKMIDLCINIMKSYCHLQIYKIVQYLKTQQDHQKQGEKTLKFLKTTLKYSVPDISNMLMNQIILESLLLFLNLFLHAFPAVSAIRLAGCILPASSRHFHTAQLIRNSNLSDNLFPQIIIPHRKNKRIKARLKIQFIVIIRDTIKCCHIFSYFVSLSAIEVLTNIDLSIQNIHSST